MRLLVSLVLSFFLFNCHAQNLSKQLQLDLEDNLAFKKHQPIDLIKDLELVQQKLKENHPNLYWYISKKELNKKFDSLKFSLDKPFTSMQFKAKLMSVLSLIGDGHIELNLNINGGVNHPACQQLLYKIIGDKLYIIKNSSPDLTILDQSNQSSKI